MAIREQIEEMKAGNQQAFKELIDDFSPQLNYLLKQSGLPPQIAKDVHQEVWINVWEMKHIFICKKNASDAEIKTDFLKWLQKILGWKLGSAWRKIFRQKKYVSFNLDSNGTPMNQHNQPDKNFNPFVNQGADLYPWEQQLFLKKLPKFLSEKDKQLLVFRYFEQRSWPEIEAILKRQGTSVSQAALRKRKERIISKLREHFLQPKKAEAFF